jgi:plasmid maintenance system antidote protein VapI
MKLLYNPNKVSHPGETLRDWLDERVMTRHCLSAISGLHINCINLIINGDMNIIPVYARKLEKAGAGTEKFWLKRQEIYDSNK